MCTGPWRYALRPKHVERRIGLMREWSMPKILLFRVAHDLSASLMSELSRAGYDVATPESADVRTVLQQQPDLILLQTDVRTLDCCGLLTQLKGNEGTAPVKIMLLADGGPLERSRALDLGADDVLSIPFERVELFARIRAQLREKAPDDRLRLEVLDAKRKELEAEAALAAIVTQKETGKKRWIVLQIEREPGYAAGESALTDTHSRSASGARTKEPRSAASGIECFGEQAIGRVAGRECRPAQADIYFERRVPG